MRSRRASEGVRPVRLKGTAGGAGPEVRGRVIREGELGARGNTLEPGRWQLGRTDLNLH